MNTLTLDSFVHHILNIARWSSRLLHQNQISGSTAIEVSGKILEVFWPPFVTALPQRSQISDAVASTTTLWCFKCGARNHQVSKCQLDQHICFYCKLSGYMSKEYLYYCLIIRSLYQYGNTILEIDESKLWNLSRSRGFYLSCQMLVLVVVSSINTRQRKRSCVPLGSLIDDWKPHHHHMGPCIIMVCRLALIGRLTKAHHRIVVVENNLKASREISHQCHS